MELRISEHDEAGRDIATYVSSKGSDRIEFIVCLVLLSHRRTNGLRLTTTGRPLAGDKGPKQSVDTTDQRLSSGRLSSQRD